VRRRIYPLERIERRDVIIALFASLVAGPLNAQNAAGSILIAVPEFGVSPDQLERGRDLARVIVADLRSSGIFMPLDPAKYSGIVINTDDVPRFNKWRALRVDGLVTGRISLQSDGRFKVEVRLWDVVAGQQLYGAQYFADPNQWNRIPHIIADAIFERLTGQAGRFEERSN
jgi:TolB protein